MANVKELKLVDGIFNSEHAKDILSHLFDKKINFHACRILFMEEKFGFKDDYSKKRIKELQAAKAEMLEMVDLASVTDQNIEVHADIKISFTAEATTSKVAKTLEMS